MRVFKAAVFLACLSPLLWLGFAAALGALGANPVEALIRSLGDWALRLVLITLCMTPLRQVTGWGGFIRVRRMLGLFAFFYAALHLIAYAGIDLELQWAALLRDITKRPFITMGALAFVLLLPLALTSTDRAIRSLGSHWRRLHRLIYLITALACLHYYWMVKLDTHTPLLYAGITGVLLTWRLVVWMRRG